jgi:iron complex transport system substrate-binding protein
MLQIARGPSRIVCLTEETTEWLYLLGEEARIVGISGYTVRPRRAREEKPRVSAFLSAKIDKILELEPDCVFGFSDLQADIAAELVRRGVQVTIFNQRSVAEIFAMLYQVAAMVGRAEEGLKLLEGMRERLLQVEAAARALSERSHSQSASGRIVADAGEVVRSKPDVILGSWCGKKFRPEKVAARPGWDAIPAVKNGQLHEIKSADILQPGPAALTDGVRRIHEVLAAIS